MKRLLPVLALVLLMGELGTIQQDYDPPSDTIASSRIVNVFPTGGNLQVNDCNKGLGSSSWDAPISSDCLIAQGTSGTSAGAVEQFYFEANSQPDWVNFTLGVNGFSGSAAQFCLTYTDIPDGTGALTLTNSGFCLWSAAMTEQTTTCTATFGYSGGGMETSVFGKPASNLCSSQIAVQNNWVSHTAHWYRNGVSIGNHGFISIQNSADGFGVNLRTQSASIANAVIDNIEITNVQIPEQVPQVQPPSEFDSGLLAFITGLGFITPASQFFFSLILIGVATVSGGVALKFMAPGRMKIVIVASIAVLVGAFCAILKLFDLWMFVLAAVLAGTVIKGAGEVRNTWREIRSTIANRARTIDQDGQIVAGPGPEPIAAPEVAGDAD